MRIQPRDPGAKVISWHPLRGLKGNHPLHYIYPTNHFSQRSVGGWSGHDSLVFQSLAGDQTTTNRRKMIVVDIE